MSAKVQPKKFCNRQKIIEKLVDLRQSYKNFFNLHQIYKQAITKKIQLLLIKSRSTTFTTQGIGSNY